MKPQDVMRETESDNTEGTGQRADELAGVWWAGSGSGGGSRRISGARRGRWSWRLCGARETSRTGARRRGWMGMDGWINDWMEGWKDAWVHGMDGWMDGYGSDDRGQKRERERVLSELLDPSPKPLLSRTPRTSSVHTAVSYTHLTLPTICSV
eukprot:1028202-Rhodomonas_salina.1